jgi:cell division protein FtsX
MKFVVKNLFRRKLRTFFSVVGVGISVSIMVALFTISDDLISQLNRVFETQRGDIVVTQATAEELESDVPLYYVDVIREIEGVRHASPMLVALLRTEGDFVDRPFIPYYGVTESHPVARSMEILEGEGISDDDPFGVVFGSLAWQILQDKMGDRAPKVGEPLMLVDIIASEGFEQVFGHPENWDEMSDYARQMWALIRLVRELGVHPDAIQEETPDEYTARTGREAPPPRPRNIMGLPYDDEQYTDWLKERHGIDYDPDDPVYSYQMKLRLTTRGVARTGIHVQDAAVWFHLDVAQVIKGKHEREEIVRRREDGRWVEQSTPRDASCSTIIVEVEDTGLSREERDVLVDRVREEINSRIPAIRAVRSEQFMQRHSEIGFLENFGLVISLIAALAGAIGILNIMTLSVYERTREIGLLLAVGWSRYRVLSTVMLEGLLLALIGGLAGVAFGYLEVQLAREYLALDVLSTGLNIKRSLQAMGLAFVIGLLATLYPALRASLLTPIDALRHE